MTSTSDTYKSVIGTSTASGQVHMAHGTSSERMSQLCRFGSSTQYLTKIIATLPESGREATLNALLANMIKMSKLCKNCFPHDLREAYRARIRAAAAEDATAQAPALPDQEPNASDTLDLDHVEFGRDHLISPTGIRYAVVDGDDDGGPRGAYLWLVRVGADGIRTGIRQRRLFDTEAQGWTIEPRQPEPARKSVDVPAAPVDEEYEEEPPELAHLTGDVVVFGTDEDGAAHVLMILRRWDPYKGAWALPGGHLNEGELISAAAFRELVEESGIRPGLLRFFAFYDDPQRDDRGRYVTFAYTATVDGLPQPTAGDDAADARWLKVADVRAGRYAIAFDHARIIEDAALYNGLTT